MNATEKFVEMLTGDVIDLCSRKWPTACCDMGQPAGPGHIKSMCPFVAMATADVINSLGGERAIFQAGSASWHRGIDDAEEPWFSYRWDGQPPPAEYRSGLAVLAEVHCWVALPRIGVIVDLSAAWQHEQCKALTGLECKPQPAFFGTAKTLHERNGLYVAYPRAIEYVLTLVQKGPEAGNQYLRRFAGPDGEKLATWLGP